MAREEREIKIRSFTYRDEVENASGKMVTVIKQARMGDVVDLPERAITRGEELDAFVTEEDRAETTPDEEALAVSEMDEDQLTNWVSEATIPQVLNAANDDPDMAVALLEAEKAATGGDPRQGLVEGLGRIAGSDE